MFWYILGGVVIVIIYFFVDVISPKVKAKKEAEAAAAAAEQKRLEEWRKQEELQKRLKEEQKRLEEEKKRLEEEQEEAPACEFSYGVNGEGDGVVIWSYKGSRRKLRIPAVIEGFPVKEIVIRDYDKKKETVTSVIFPAGVIGVAFAGFSNLQTVELPAGVIYVYFHNCKSLKSINLPDRINEIGFWAFKGTSLQSITLHEVGVIRGSAFEDCQGLTTVNINGNIGNIEIGAFKGCDNLTTANIGPNVTRIGDVHNIISYRMPLETQAALRKLRTS